MMATGKTQLMTYPGHAQTLTSNPHLGIGVLCVFRSADSNVDFAFPSDGRGSIWGSGAPQPTFPAGSSVYGTPGFARDLALIQLDGKASGLIERHGGTFK